jgi:hypothetical protein
MKRALIVAVALGALVALPMTSWAQAKPDLSGSWKLDEAKSDPAPAARAGGGGGGGRGGGGTAASMTITQTAAQITIDRVMGQGTQSAVYKLDGSESLNKMGMGEAKSKASWDGSTLVIATSQTMQGPNGEMSMTSKEVYSLVGGILTIQTTRTTPMGEQSRKLVYSKG